MKSIILKVKGMSCRHCEARIVKELAKQKGIQSSVASFKKAQVDIIYDETLLSLERIKKVIEDTGYEVERE